MKEFFKGLFTDEKGKPSSKRFVGILAGLTLCVTLFANSFSSADVKPSPELVNAVAMLSFGALGLASTDNIFGKKNNKDKSDETNS